MKEPLFVPYCDARRKIRGGDLLLFRPRGFVWRAIAVAGRSEYTHAAMAGWWSRRLMCVEMCIRGGRALLLSNIVRRWPGAIDVYRANASGTGLAGGTRRSGGGTGLARGTRRFSRAAAVRAMIEITGRRYGWFNLFRAALLHLPLFRFLVAPETDDAADSAACHRLSQCPPPFCSQAVAMATRAGGVDPVPNLADRLTEPADLSRSSFYAYRFTLTWEEESSTPDPEEAKK
ncbi:MAG: hypothetical protein KKE86_03365 [Planctomycetes bacterium]|nr:hypothetical protein [Planctomycetota bacterium]